MTGHSSATSRWPYLLLQVLSAELLHLGELEVVGGLEDVREGRGADRHRPGVGVFEQGADAPGAHPAQLHLLLGALAEPVGEHRVEVAAGSGEEAAVCVERARADAQARVAQLLLEPQPTEAVDHRVAVSTRRIPVLVVRHRRRHQSDVRATTTT